MQIIETMKNINHSLITVKNAKESKKWESLKHKNDILLNTTQIMQKREGTL